MRIFILFSVLIITFYSISLAETSGIKITEPLNGSKVNPGQELTVKVDSVDGFIPIQVLIVTSFSVDTLKSSPFISNIVIPKEAAGEIFISATGKNALGKFMNDEITLEVQQTASLESLQIQEDKIYVWLDWDGNIKQGDSDYFGAVYGTYSDGITRDISEDNNTTYLSSDTSIISIDNKNHYTIYKVGNASVTISNSGISKLIPVEFKEPYGKRPKETILPTTQINIQPEENSSGWHNNDITVIITAQDNEGGSGIREINYSVSGRNDMFNQCVQNSEINIFFDKEGSFDLVYGAVDKEGNYNKGSRHKFKLDKTSPVLTITATPAILWPPNNKMVDVTVKGEAIDKLSGIESISFKVTDEYGKVQPSIPAFGSIIKLEASRRGNDQDGRIYTITATAKDKAGNESHAFTTVIVPHDMGKEAQ